jgi:hypothetical protein
MLNAILRSGLTALASVMFAVILSGQSKPSTPITKKASRPAVVQIGDHKLGETFDEWLTVAKIDLDAICNDTTSGSVYEVEQRSMTCSGLQPIKDTGDGEFHDLRSLPADAEVGDRWTFVNGKLARLQNVYSTEIMTKELGFLKEAYGPPTLITKTPQQNAFGAKWNNILVTWHLPGGARLYMKADGGPDGKLIITFASRVFLNQPVNQEPNPYLPQPPRQ